MSYRKTSNCTAVDCIRKIKRRYECHKLNSEQIKTYKSNASNDLLLFLQIAKELNISVRFAGHEPLDRFTAQYNLNMRSVLKKYGVDFCEINRKKAGDEYISASIVREYLKQNKFDEIKKLVPQCTYEYLYRKDKEL